MSSPRARFISFEGTEGCGKSTQVAMLEAWLVSQRYEVLVLREPGGTVVGEAVRHVLKHDPDIPSMHPETELLLFAASRAELTRQRILPHLKKGGWVLCDRFLDSTTVYQGVGRRLNMEAVNSINDFATGGLRPGLTLLLDLPAAVAMQRMRSRVGEATAPDRMEQESDGFYEIVCQAYRELADRENGRVVTVAADTDRDTLFNAIKEVVRHAFPGELDS
ncbi:MAG: dTMP kinase [Candidatus Methylacidiphilales bacterium]